MNLLIDGSSLIWRTYYANKAQKRNTLENNIYSFLISLKSYANMYNTNNIYIAWDKKMGDGKNFRQIESEDSYKGHRDKDLATDVYQAQEEISLGTTYLGCKNLFPYIMEADDIIAWLSKTLEGQSCIITTDKDMLQLINDNVFVYDPKKKITIDKENFESIVNVSIEEFLPYKAILGDVSDNIKGIYGCGKIGSRKVAKQWIEDKTQIEDDKIKIIEENIKMMDLSNGYKYAGEKEVSFYEEQIELLANLSMDEYNFKSFCEKYNFKSILNNLEKWKNIFETPYLLSILNNLSF